MANCEATGWVVHLGAVMRKPNPLIAVSRLIERLQSSTYWLKESGEYADSTMIRYQIAQNEELLKAVHKAFDGAIEAGERGEL